MYNWGEYKIFYITLCLHCIIEGYMYSMSLLMKLHKIFFEVFSEANVNFSLFEFI